MIRQPVVQLSKKGPLPSEVGATVESVREFQELIGRIDAPVSDDEARLLCKAFGPDEDSCYGLAWSVLHLVESAPGWPLSDCVSLPNSHWLGLLHARAANGGLL